MAHVTDQERVIVNAVEDELSIGVCTENSGSDVLVVQSADERMRRNTSDPLNRTRYRGILVQGTMGSRLIVIACVRAQDAAQVLLAQRHHVVSAFAADGANQSFGKTILPRRSAEIGLSRMPMARNRRLTTGP